MLNWLDVFTACALKIQCFLPKPDSKFWISLCKFTPDKTYTGVGGRGSP